MAVLKAEGYDFNAFSRICKECEKDGSLPEDAVECPHVFLRSGNNKSTQKRKLMNKITLDSELNAIENQGRLLEPESIVFKEQQVLGFIESVENSDLSRIPFILQTFDPNAGGSCDFVGAAWTYIGGRWILLWANHTPASAPEDHIAFFLDSIRTVSARFRKQQDCCIAVCIEANSRIDAGYVDIKIKTSVDPEFRNVLIVTDHTKSNEKMPGVLLGASRKKEMVEDFAMRLKDRSVVIHKDFYTTHKRGIAYVLATIKSQLLVFRKLKDKYTGKVGGNQDDYVIALCMQWWGKQLLTNSEYVGQLKKIGFMGLNK